MDTQPISSAKIKIESKPKLNKTSLPPATESSSTSGDKVRLSQDAKSMIQRDKVSSSKITSAGIEQRKLSVTENNDVVLEVIDPKTQKVVRTVPSEKHLELRDAIRDELDKV